jgi:hypothetical protein
MRVELATRWETEAELEAVRTSAARVWDLVLGSANGPSSLAAPMSMLVELLQGWIDAAQASGVRWGSCSVLIATMLHFPELKTEREVLRFGCSVDLTKDEADAL